MALLQETPQNLIAVVLLLGGVTMLSLWFSIVRFPFRNFFAEFTAIVG